MFNITFKGNYKNEKQLQRELPINAVKYKEPEGIEKAVLISFIMSLPIVVVTSILFIRKIESIDNITWSIFFCSLMLILICLFIHEYIHAMSMPRKIKKEIWVALQKGVLFMYFNELISKKRFMWVSIAPNLFLGFLPFVLFILGFFDFSYSLCNIVGIVSWSMILAGVGDYYNIFLTIRQVPKDAKVLNCGQHSFWVLNQ